MKKFLLSLFLLFSTQLFAQIRFDNVVYGFAFDRLAGVGKTSAVLNLNGSVNKPKPEWVDGLLASNGIEQRPEKPEFIVRKCKGFQQIGNERLN